MEFIDLNKQYQYLKSRIDARINKVLEHGKYIMGPEVQELEEKLASYVGVKYAITCGNGTDALQLALMALDIKQGDAVFCPTFTFFATAEAPAFIGATPVFVDSDKTTFNICPKDLVKRIEQVLEKGKLIPKAIIAVDLFGLPANYAELEKIARKYGLMIIEDAAQGLGGSINGKKAGSFGNIATTSFFPAKPLGCYGDGGAVFTNDDGLAELVKSYRIHGKGRDKYDNIRIGMNSRLDTIQAAILLEKLANFPIELTARQEAADKYTKKLHGIAITPIIPDGYKSSWAQYTLITKERDELIKKCNEQNIPTVVYYKKCMHVQTAFQNLGYATEDFPVAQKLSQSVVSLPMHAYLSSDIDTVIKGVTC